jgi:hypothetical protein
MRGALLVSQIRKFIASEVPIAIEVGPINPASRFDVVISASLCSFAADAVCRRCAWPARPGAPSLHVVPNCGRALRDHADRLSGCVSGQNPPGAVERPGIRAPRLCPAVPAGPGLSVAGFRSKGRRGHLGASQRSWLRPRPRKSEQFPLRTGEAPLLISCSSLSRSLPLHAPWHVAGHGEHQPHHLVTGIGCRVEHARAPALDHRDAVLTAILSG